MAEHNLGVKVALKFLVILAGSKCPVRGGSKRQIVPSFAIKAELDGWIQKHRVEINKSLSTTFKQDTDSSFSFFQLIKKKTSSGRCSKHMEIEDSFSFPSSLVKVQLFKEQIFPFLGQRDLLWHHPQTAGEAQSALGWFLIMRNSSFLFLSWILALSSSLLVSLISLIFIIFKEIDKR